MMHLEYTNEVVPEKLNPGDLVLRRSNVGKKNASIGKFDPYWK